MSDALKTYDVVVARLREIYIAKNAAYGNSFDTTIDKFGYVAALVRMHDKMERLRTLILNKQPENDESMLDTAMDLANYAIMLTSKLTRDAPVRDMPTPKKSVCPYCGESFTDFCRNHNCPQWVSYKDAVAILGKHARRLEERQDE